ncbi:MAG: hypothetical protein WAS27_04500 [Candidatus Saccharimonadales bacterium]
MEQEHTRPNHTETEVATEEAYREVGAQAIRNRLAEASGAAQKAVDAIDDILDEIGTEYTELDADEFVANFQQKNGQ